MEVETGYPVKANRKQSLAIIAALVILSSVGLYLSARDPYSENEIRHLLENAYNAQRPGGGRLSGAPYSSVGGVSRTQPNLGEAQILVLRHPDSEAKAQLQGLIYLAAGDWEKYVEAKTRALPATRRDAATLNNLGACFLALSEDDPSNLLKALDEFERAARLDPKAPEPRFNLVITYRKLRLRHLADEASERYASIDPESPWQRELSVGDATDEPALIDSLRHAVESDNRPEAERLFEKDPSLFQNLAGQYGSSDIEESPALLRFIASEMERRYGDETFSAMLDPLFTEKRKATITLRQFVTEGAELFVAGNLTGSLEAYAKAEELLGQTDSVFDRLWIDLNRTDTQIRAGQFQAARQSLQRIVSVARKNKFIWLTGKALAVYGSTMRLTPSYAEMINLLAEADRLFVDIGARRDRVRPLYYLAIYQYGAGDHDAALKLALECLQVSNDSDPLRMSSLDWLIGSILYTQQMVDKAILFETESVEKSQKVTNPSVVATTASALAELYESVSNIKLAENYLKIAEDALKRVPPGLDQIRTDPLLGILRAKIDFDRKQYAKAESLLEKNLEIYSRQPFRATTPVLLPSLMLLARTYSETNQIKKAAQTFNEAINVVEGDDQYLKEEKLRIKFDDERRELYDSAIEFEFNNGSPDAAWTYLQKYRSKLFIEFLAAFDPHVEEAHAKALDRSRVQTLIPSDVQVVEYALLKDRLLIWLISKNTFAVRSVAVPRSEVETKVQDVLQGLRQRDDVDVLLTGLGKLLVEPVADLLEANRTLVIIPDRALHGLPFGVLRQPGKRRYLIEDFPILISPNLTHLLLTDAVRPSREGIIGFGSQNGGSSELKELGSLASIYPKSETFAGREVDKSKFLEAMSEAAVFHYAGHSATDAVDPLRSSILLDGNRFGPNSVTAVDIAQQRLKKNAVVVLSSCDSSIGNSRDGIGMRGLTSAFLIAGAGSVVGSLWPVEESSTADLMIRFHRAFVNSHMPVAKALREAQLAFLRSFPERSHPYYWSGFVVTGNFSALR